MQSFPIHETAILFIEQVDATAYESYTSGKLTAEEYRSVVQEIGAIHHSILHVLAQVEDLVPREPRPDVQ